MRRLIICVIAAASLLGGCYSNPSTGRNQFILFNAGEIAAMGEEAKPQMIAEFGGEVPSHELRAYVDRVGRALAAHVEPEFSTIDWEFITLESDVINAFALPGGKVFITRGLLSRFDNEAQVAGVLGHEIGHVTARHVDERLSQAAIAQIGLEVLGGYTESQVITMGSSLAIQGALLKFNRDQESESDTQGLKYMTAAGYDPFGLEQVLLVLLAASAGSGQPAEILSTHPHPETRLEDVRRALATTYKYTQGNPSFGRFPQRFDDQAAPYLRR